MPFLKKIVVLTLSSIFILTAPTTARAGNKLWSCLTSPLSAILDRVNVLRLPHFEESFQEAIWEARREGNLEKAKQIEQELREKISKGKVTKIKPIGEGASNKGRYFLDTGISGIVKSGDNILEVVAYDLDQVLGLDRVPLTVLKSIDGSPHTFQVWIPYSETADVDVKKIFAEGSGIAHNERHFFNYLAGKTVDENFSQNIIFTRDGRALIIDNQIMLFRDGLPPTRIPLSEMVPRKSVYKNLLNFTDQKIDLFFEKYKNSGKVSYFTKGNIERFKSRRRVLLEYLSKNPHFLPEESAQIER